ncbi:MAG: hypothetical protein CVU63_11380 [Deltaproteobacteria bacterium HGW-Deltaproteobacteria-20]|nr:MAG: hypothetical protein CVU63_11380 [Deltaproteobacteria bacterium HGW-Deltaproteobacteria-20]
MSPSACKGCRLFSVVLLGLVTAGGTRTVQAQGEPSNEKKVCADQALNGQRLAGEEKLLAARAAYTACAADTCPGPVTADCRRWLAELMPTIPSVVFFLDDAHEQSSALVWLDGTLLVEKYDGKPVLLDPGIHEFRFVVDGKSVTRDIVIRKGEKNRRIDVPVPPRSLAQSAPAPTKDPASEAPDPSTPASVYVLAGVAGVALTVGGYLGVTGLSQRSDLRDTCYPGCTTEDVDATRRRLLVADIAGAVAVAALGGALWIYLDTPSEVRVGTSHAGGATLGVLSGSF